MDLIYMNSEKEDVGVLNDYSLDLAIGNDENDLQCTLPLEQNCLAGSYYLYMEGSEYGGIVDRVKVDTKNKRVQYTGRSWHGILESKVICPDAGEDYLIVSGEANLMIGQLLTRLELTDLFEVSTADSGLTISSYSMNRYIGGYSGILKMLKSVGAKLKITFGSEKVQLSAEAIADYSEDEEFDSSQISFVVEKKYNPINHLICLGTGELANRQVIHLYADTNGIISTIQTQFGMNEVTDIYENANTESLEELEKGGKERIKESWSEDALQFDFPSTEEGYDIGDIVGATEQTTKLSVAAVIKKKIVTIKNGITSVSYEVGE